MPATCPTGFFCFDRTTMVLLVIVVIVIVVFLVNYHQTRFFMEKAQLQNNIQNYKMNLSQSQQTIKLLQNRQTLNEQNVPSRLVRRQVSDPLTAPSRTHVAINVPTRGEVASFQQVGALIEQAGGGDSKVLPLYGKPTYPGSRKWLYYTSNDSYSPVKLPVNSNNRCCLDEYGCDELYTDSQVSVDGFQHTFKVNLYKLNKPRYIPYIV